MACGWHSHPQGWTANFCFFDHLVMRARRRSILHGAAGKKVKISGLEWQAFAIGQLSRAKTMVVSLTRFYEDKK
jgi:hypothetical protein